MSVELELKNGKRRKFHPQVAKVLVSRGLGYETREMRAKPGDSLPTETELVLLRREADRRGIKYHHRTGVAKLRELLEG